MTDKILAVLSMTFFLAFIGFLAVWVNEPDLWVVVVVVAAMGAYDFWRSCRPGGEANGAS